MAPTPAAMNGTRAPTAKNFVAIAMPKPPVALSRAMIDHVILQSFRALPAGGLALRATRVDRGAAVGAVTRSYPENHRLSKNQWPQPVDELGGRRMLPGGPQAYSCLTASPMRPDGCAGWSPNGRQPRLRPAA